jgi:hypothetical protein
VPDSPLHKFTLVLEPLPGPPAPAGGYQRLRETPPDGCRVIEDGPPLVLECHRLAPSRADAVVGLVAEIRERYGIAHADDLGIEKLWEWSADDFGSDVTVQLLLMALRRAELLGWGVEDAVRLMRGSRTRS